MEEWAVDFALPERLHELWRERARSIVLAHRRIVIGVASDPLAREYSVFAVDSSGQPLWLHTEESQDALLVDLETSADAHYVAVTTGVVLQLFVSSVGSLAQLWQITADDLIAAVSFSPSGERVCVVDESGLVRLLETVSGVELWSGIVTQLYIGADFRGALGLGEGQREGLRLRGAIVDS